MTAMSGERRDPARLRDLMLYVAGACLQRPSFGGDALATALYLSDFGAYDRLGRSITGSSYVKGPRGPVPAGFDEAFDALVEEGRAVVESERDRACLVPVSGADVSMFTVPELRLVDEVIGQLGAGSEWSYGAGWNAVEYGEEIPYCFAGVSDDELSAADIARAREIAAHGVRWSSRSPAAPLRASWFA